MLTIKDKLIEKQPIHDHYPNAHRTDGKQFISYEECYEYFQNMQKQNEIKLATTISYEYLDDWLLYL